MDTTNRYLIFQVLVLVCLLHMSYALECKVCQKNDPSCLLGENVETRNCVDDDDFCFTWFDRKGGKVGVQRDCISSDKAEYKTIKEMIDDRDSGCVKHVNSFDCFTFCSVDKCN